MSDNLQVVAGKEELTVRKAGQEIVINRKQAIGLAWMIFKKYLEKNS